MYLLNILWYKYKIEFTFFYLKYAYADKCYKVKQSINDILSGKKIPLLDPDSYLQFMNYSVTTSEPTALWASPIATPPQSPTLTTVGPDSGLALWSLCSTVVSFPKGRQCSRCIMATSVWWDIHPDKDGHPHLILWNLKP